MKTLTRRTSTVNEDTATRPHSLFFSNTGSNQVVAVSVKIAGMEDPACTAPRMVMLEAGKALIAVSKFSAEAVAVTVAVKARTETESPAPRSSVCRLVEDAASTCAVSVEFTTATWYSTTTV